MKALISLFFMTPFFAQGNTCVSLLGKGQSVVRKDSNQSNRQDLIKTYADVNFRTEAENTKWINVATKDREKGLYIEVTASELKNLNDKIIRNRDLVTALVNLRKEFDFKFISELTKGIEGVEIYSDFKTVRVFIPGEHSADSFLVEEFQERFKRSERDFREKVIGSGLVRESDLLTSWFQMGVSNTADLASIAARKAKSQGVLSYDLLNAEALKSIEDERVSLIEDYERFQKRIELSYLFDYIENQKKLKLEVLMIYRKNRDPESFIKAINALFGYHMSLEKGRELVSFFERIDLFSPSLLIAKRTSVAVKNVGQGAFSLDFIGLGAKNLQETIEGVLYSGSVDDMVFKIRANEARLTREFEKQKKEIIRIVEHHFDTHRWGFDLEKREFVPPIIVFSGDEGVIVPNREVFIDDVMRIQKSFLEYFQTSQLRMTYVKADGEGKLDTSVVSLAESIDKALKLILTPYISPYLLSKTQFNIWMWKENESSSRRVSLTLYSETPHSNNQRRHIEEAFKALIHNLNESTPDMNIHADDRVYGSFKH